MIAAFLSLAAGSLVHYSAGPYLVFVTLHYSCWLFWRRPNKWQEAVTIVLLCTILLLTWFGWSLKTYGMETFVSNTSVTFSQKYEGNYATKAAGNLFDSIVPVALRKPSLLEAVEQPNSMANLRENAFLFYQSNMVFGMGLVGGPVVLYLLWKRFRFKQVKDRSERWFWLAFVFFCVIVGTGVVGERDEYGVAHLTLLSLEMLGLTLLASGISQSRILLWVVVGGCLLDFSLGILLHAHIQHMENEPGKVVFRDPEFSNSMIIVPEPGPEGLTKRLWKNWNDKHRLKLYDRWLEELPQRYGNDEQFQKGWPSGRDEFLRRRGELETHWGGWYSRHNGEIEYVGDHMIGRLGEGIPASILLALSAGVFAVLIKNMPSASVVPVTTRRAARARRPKRGKKASR